MPMRSPRQVTIAGPATSVSARLVAGKESGCGRAQQWRVDPARRRHAPCAGIDDVEHGRGQLRHRSQRQRAAAGAMADADGSAVAVTLSVAAASGDLRTRVAHRGHRVHRHRARRHRMTRAGDGRHLARRSGWRHVQRRQHQHQPGKPRHRPQMGRAYRGAEAAVHRDSLGAARAGLNSRPASSCPAFAGPGRTRDNAAWVPIWCSPCAG
jgi:hypothetical protein